MVQDRPWASYWRVSGRAALLGWFRKLLARQLCEYFRQQVRGLGVTTRTLEAGCGSAVVSGMLSERGWLCVGLDTEALALQVARRMSPRLRAVQGDLYESCFRRDAFDLVWNNSTLEHLSDPLRALREMTNVVRPGGSVFVGVPYTYGPLAIFKLKRQSFGGTWDGTTFSRKALVDLFQGAGLQVIDCRLFFFRSFVGVMGRKP